MKEIKYQQKYVRQLVDMAIDLLRLSGHRRTLIFKAPTGHPRTSPPAPLFPLHPQLKYRVIKCYSLLINIYDSFLNKRLFDRLDIGG